MWHEQGRSLTEEEKNKIIQEAERAYNREVRQRRKLMNFDKVASVPNYWLNGCSAMQNKPLLTNKGCQFWQSFFIQNI